MFLTVRVDNPPPSAKAVDGGRSGRRDTIYPHRSVRALPLDAVRLWVGIGLALLITGWSVWNAVPLMEAHSRVAAVLAGWAGLPVTGWAPVGVFPGLEPASGPLLTIPAFKEVSEGARLALILSIVALLVVARRFSLFRNVANFLLVLLVASAVANAVFDNFRLESITFGQIWLRQEMLVWLLLPWVLLLLFVIPQPNLLRGVMWVLFLQAYGFLFSALRMVFVLGMLHYTGLIFMPPLWFLLGTMSDLLFVLFFYSLSIHRSSGELWGVRNSWQSHF
jgi:hypothetical protein